MRQSVAGTLNASFIFVLKLELTVHMKAQLSICTALTASIFTLLQNHEQTAPVLEGWKEDKPPAI